MHYSKVTEKKNAKGYAYWVEGDSSKKPLILISGFTGTHGDLLSFARFLKEKYFVIMPEFPGWGDSSEGSSSFTISSYANYIGELLKELNIQQAILIGHCMGATIALETAYKFSQKIQEIILISTPYQEGTMGNIFFEAMAFISERAPSFLRPFFFFWRSRIITIPLSFVVLQTRTFERKIHLIKQTALNQSGQNEHVLETNWDSLIRYNYNKLRKLTIPVHLFHGGKDVLVEPQQSEKLSRIFTYATVDIIPHAGHLPPIETPETLARFIEKYLA